MPIVLPNFLWCLLKEIVRSHIGIFQESAHHLFRPEVLNFVNNGEYIKSKGKILRARKKGSFKRVVEEGIESTAGKI